MNKPSIRFTLSGEHKNEHVVYGNIEGYNELAKRILKATENKDVTNNALNIKIDDLLIYDDKSEDIGFDTFILDDNCGTSLETIDANSKIRLKDKVAVIGCGILIAISVLLMLYGAFSLYYTFIK